MSRSAAAAVRLCPVGRAQTKANGLFRHEVFLAVVLGRDLLCRCELAHEHGHGQRCRRRSEVAALYPVRRAQLVERGLDPTDPVHGRGLCPRCHAATSRRPHPGLKIRTRPPLRGLGRWVRGLGAGRGARWSERGPGRAAGPSPIRPGGGPAAPMVRRLLIVVLVAVLVGVVC